MNQNPKKLKLRERIYKRIFLIGDWYKSIVKVFNRLCRIIINVTLSLFVLGFIFYIGFGNSTEILTGLKKAFRIIFILIFFSKYVPEGLIGDWKKDISMLFRLIVFLFSLGVLLSNFRIVYTGEFLDAVFYGSGRIILAIFLMGISEAHRLLKVLSSARIPPALIFSLSFALIILVGTGLLMLPRSHEGHLSMLDSLFTSVSAVCVTGLIVVDTGTTFTLLGKIIILCLIQIGGLGIMTFTGFFGFIFASGSSFRNNMLLKELFSSETINNLLKLLTKIILLTLLLEAIGALIIYSSLAPDHQYKVAFSIFHSVSAFCNAGFSTYSGNLYSAALRHNTTMQLTIAILIILGGIGFPVLTGLYSDFKNFIGAIVRTLQGKLKHLRPVQKNVSRNIVLFMTAALILGGTLLYYLFETGNSLKGMSTIQKIIISFFGSVSARTAGFNIIDLSLWGYPTVFIMIFLMWIGASPGSTGGGIKTTTFALAIRTAWNNIRGKDHLNIGNREISNITITRVLSVIVLSIVIIGVGFFGLLLSEPGKNPVHLLFECFSAYSTVGLSIADSSTFSPAGKVIDIILMFIGRVGPLTLLTGFLLSSRKSYSRYPEMEIVIN